MPVGKRKQPGPRQRDNACWSQPDVPPDQTAASLENAEDSDLLARQSAPEDSNLMNRE